MSAKVLSGIGISSLAAATCYSLHRFLFTKPSLKEYEYPYRKPGLTFRMKWFLYWIRELFFRRYLRRFNFINLDGATASEIGVLPNELHKQMESPQEVGSPDAMDEIGFMGVNLTSGEMLNVSLAKRQGNYNEAVVHFVVTDYDGKRREFELPQLPTTLHRNKQDSDGSWTCGDLRIWCLRALCRWRISFNGLLRDKNSGEVCYVVFNFVWQLYSRVVDHFDDVSSYARVRALALSQSKNPIEELDVVLNHYDELGSFFGTLSVNDGPETELVLFGSKSRRTGNFDLSSTNRLIQIKGYVEDGSNISFNAINIPDRLPEMVWGYIELGNGFRQLIKSSDFELLRIRESSSFPEVLSVRFKTDEDDYVLDIACKNGDFSHFWGPNQELKVNCNNLAICLTSMYHDLRLEGKGVVSFGTHNDIKFEPHPDLPPMISEPDVDASQFHNVNILKLTDTFCKSSKLVGGKGSSLAILKQIKGDYEVPDGLCITVSANIKHIMANSNINNMIKNIVNICCGKIKGKTEEECKILGDAFKETDLSKELKEDLRSQLTEVFGDAFERKKFAVRSSALGEDGEEISAAGQMDTVLGCKGFDQVCEGVKKCWASCFGFRATEYKRQNGQPIDDGMAVVVQEMVPADKAGVLFTRDPVNGNPAVISIAANYGIGESVVSALSEPDTIVVNRTLGNELSLGEVTIGKKQLKVVMEENGGVKESDVGEADTKSCCLSTEEAEKLAGLGVLLEQSYGDPRDIEWAISGGQIYLLQARPITNLHNENEYFLKNEMNSPFLTDHQCSTSGNIKEVFPGASSVLNLSFNHSLFTFILVKISRDFGMFGPINGLASKNFVSVQRHLFNDREMARYRIFQKSGVNQWIKRFLDGMDVATQGRVIKDEELAKVALKRHRYARFYDLINFMISQTLASFKNRNQLELAKKKFENFKLTFDDWSTSEELLSILRNDFGPYSEALLNHMNISVDSVRLNTGVLTALLGSETDFTDTHFGDFALLLSTGSSTEEVESADVPNALQNLAKEIADKSDPEQFIKMSKEDGERFLSSEDSPVKDAYRDFIQRHGHRCLKEFDMYSKTWAMEPSKLVVPLQSIVRTKAKASNKKLTVDEALTQLQTKLTTKQIKSLRKQVLDARKRVGSREQAKSLLIRTVDQYRQQFWLLGRTMVAEGRLPDEELIFFMTMEELEILVKIRSAKIIQRAIRRKRIHPQLERLRFPEICFGFPKPESEEVIRPIDGAVVLKGTPVSRGIIEGTVRVVEKVEDAHIIQPGDILVTNATDIAWSPYFPSLSGVITEIGGLVSHGAVVAREYGIPCVVSVMNATKLLKSGEKIRLNGNDGTIETLEH